MKYLLLTSLLFSFSSFGKTTVVKFTEVLNEDVQSDIKKDDERFKKDAFRAPASTSGPAIEPVIEDVPKLDKNVRQIGPNRW